MMPVAENSQRPDPIDYKKKYKALKRKLKFLLYEHECFIEELRKAQRKLLRVSRDKSFLLDRLVKYEKVDDSSDESDLTASSESETEGPKEANTGKKRKHIQQPQFPDQSSLHSPIGLPPMVSSQQPMMMASMLPASILGNLATSFPHVSGLPLGVSTAGISLGCAVTPSVVGCPGTSGGPGPMVSTQPDPAPLSTVLQHLASITSATGNPSKSPSEPPKKKAKVSKKATKTLPGTLASAAALAEAGLAGAQKVAASNVTLAGHMTREELERHLELKQSTKQQFMSIEKAPNMLPDDIFSNENSNPDSDFDPSQETGEDSDLVIDMPQD